MSEHAPGPDPADRTSRPAPAGYGASSSPAPPEPQAPPAGPSSTPGANPFYGRVTRFGAPDRPPRPADPPAAGWPPPHDPTGGAGPGAPAPWPATAAPYPSAPYPAGPYPGSPHPAPPHPYGPAVDGPGALPPGAWPPAPPPTWAVPVPARWRPDEYARWGRRVAALLIDNLPGYVAAVPVLIGYLPVYRALLHGDLTARPSWTTLVVGMVLYVASLGWVVYNRILRAGRTGQSIGKRVMGTWLVGELDGRPVGALNAFLRDLLHILDGVAYVGYLWPIWDEQRQTFSDKIMRTAVVRTPVPPLTEQERSALAG